MSNIDNGGPAFPFAPTDRVNLHMQAQGMSLRDWFAGQALMSMLNAPDKISDSTFTVAAGLSYQFADAMIEARKKVQP
jgi:hypothetical protein